jgi:hypothetical protein
MNTNFIYRNRNCINFNNIYKLIILFNVIIIILNKDYNNIVMINSLILFIIKIIIKIKVWSND